MLIQEQRQGAVTVVKPSGPLTGSDADELRARLVEVQKASLGRLVLDLSQIPFIDSRGLETLLDVTDGLAQSGQSLKLCSLNDTLREVLELTELAPLFEHFEDVNQAVRSFL